ncbi:MAG: HAMP domain-containing sensor histidine kinase [Bacteroidota bacterium]
MESGPLIKIISHDLKGPLGNMKNVADLFKTGEIQMEQAQNFMGHIEQGIDRSLMLLDELIEWSDVSSNDKEVTQEVLDLNEVIEKVITGIKEKAANKEQTLTFEKKDLPEVFFDKRALKMILKNLLVNAIHFTPNKGQIKVLVMEAMEYLHVSIIDDGIGIPKKMLPTIFEMGKDNRRFGTNKEKGIGIGLFICRDLILRNKGMVWIESTQENKGTTVMISVKRAIKPQEQKD